MSPVYDYECVKCGTWEERQHFDDPKIETCPWCGNPIVRLPGKPIMLMESYEGRIVNWASLKKDGHPYSEPKVFHDE